MSCECHSNISLVTYSGCIIVSCISSYSYQRKQYAIMILPNSLKCLYLRGRQSTLTQIVVISDTHVRTVQELSKEVLQAIREAEWVVHCGDYVSMAVVKKLRRLARHFVGVYGNADPGDVRRQLPPEVILEFEGRRIAVIHPYWGEHPDGLEEELTARFPDVDAILFGHTHEPCTQMLNGTLLLNPGQSYPSFMVPASIGILTVSKGELRGEILTLD